MRLILIAPQAAIPYFVSILKPDVEIARIVLIDMRLGRGAIDLNGRRLEVCSYDYLRETVTELCFDFILTTGHFPEIVNDDLKEAGVPRTKVFQLSPVFCAPQWLHPFVCFFRFVEPRVSEFKTFITGISNGAVGTDLSCYQLPTLRCASSSQDLYYDHLIAERLLSMNGAAFKYAIIQLTPYNFHYDLSIGGPEQWLMLPYYLGFRDVHHFHVRREDFEAIFNENFLRTDHVRPPENYSVDQFPPIWWPQFTVDKRMKARSLAEKWNAKRYPETVRENEKILDDYLSLLERHGVRPIVVLFPVIDVYRAFFSKQMLDEFHYILRRHGSGDRFDFLDKWNFDSALTYDDFFDAVHLNQSGAKKMSAFLNDYIMNLERGGR